MGASYLNSAASCRISSDETRDFLQYLLTYWCYLVARRLKASHYNKKSAVASLSSCCLGSFITWLVHTVHVHTSHCPCSEMCDDWPLFTGGSSLSCPAQTGNVKNVRDHVRAARHWAAVLSNNWQGRVRGIPCRASGYRLQAVGCPSYFLPCDDPRPCHRCNATCCFFAPSNFMAAK